MKEFEGHVDDPVCGVNYSITYYNDDKIFVSISETGYMGGGCLFKKGDNDYLESFEEAAKHIYNISELDAILSPSSVEKEITNKICQNKTKRIIKRN